MLDFIRDHATSVYLCGSLVNTPCRKNSDIDLEVIVDALSVRDRILRYVDRANSLTRGRRLFDFNIHTSQDFQRLVSSNDHFKVWSRIRNGKLLRGVPLDVHLNPELALQTLWDAYEHLEESFTLTTSHTAYKVSSFYLFEGISTFYFAELLLLGSKRFESRREALHALLGPSLASVESIYYEIVRRANVHNVESAKILSIPLKSKVSDNDFEVVEERLESILAYARSVLKQIQHLKESEWPS